VVVEVKTRGNVRRTDYWGELAAALKTKPGWRLELVVETREEGPHGPDLEIEEIRARLDDGQRLSESGMNYAAMLVDWSATEAAMRRAAATEDIDLPDHRPATLISRLYSEGRLERDEYDFLLESFRTRNALVHGFETKPIQTAGLQRLKAI